MMDKILAWAFTKTKIGKYLNGKKTALITLLTAAYCALEVAGVVAEFFPQFPIVSVIGETINLGLQQARPYIAQLGVPAITLVTLENKRKQAEAAK